MGDASCTLAFMLASDQKGLLAREKHPRSNLVRRQSRETPLLFPALDFVLKRPILLYNLISKVLRINSSYHCWP